jgi:hypothetical protein
MHPPTSPFRRPWPKAAIRALSALFLSLTAWVPLAEQQADRTIVLGQVIDAQSKAPLAGVTVRLLEPDVVAVTAADGQFRLRVRPGTYNVTLSRLGYETVLEAWRIGTESLDVGILDLAPDAIRLEALTVTTDRLERMRLSTGFRSTGYGQTDLATSSYPNALEFVRSRHSMYSVPCASMSTVSISAGGDCVRIRGGPVKVCVVLDEAPLVGGFSALREYRTGELAQVNVYSGGSFIQVYTASFMRQRANASWVPMSVQNQIMSYCRMSG